MQAVIDRRRRQAEEDRDILMRAFVNEEQGRRLPQLVREFGDRRQRRRGLLALP
jgi:hypothetical protein